MDPQIANMAAQIAGIPERRMRVTDEALARLRGTFGRGMARPKLRGGQGYDGWDGGGVVRAQPVGPQLMSPMPSAPVAGGGADPLTAALAALQERIRRQQFRPQQG